LHPDPVVLQAMLRQFPVGAQRRQSATRVCASPRRRVPWLWPPPSEGVYDLFCAPSLSHAGQEANALMTSLICTSIGTSGGFAIGMGGRFDRNTHGRRGARNGGATGDPARD
jgi:hypothetical protein